MSKCDEHEHCHCSNTTAAQSLDEMDFERGIWYAAQQGDLDRVIKLQKAVNDRDRAGYTALHYAARNGHLKICKVLVERGADINATTKAGGATALHRACSAGKEDIVKYLIEKKADLFMKDNDGKTALHRASENNHVSIINLLLMHAPSLKGIPDLKDNLPIYE